MKPFTRLGRKRTSASFIKSVVSGFAPNEEPLVVAQGSLSAVTATPLMAQLRIFAANANRDRTDELPIAAKDVVQTIATATTNRDRSVLFHESRLALKDINIEHEDLFAVPLSDGAVCYVTSAGASAGLASQLISGISWNLQFAKGARNSIVALTGLVSNDVTNVAVRGRRFSTDGLLGRNGFYWENRGPNVSLADVCALVVAWSDGRQTMVTVGGNPWG